MKKLLLSLCLLPSLALGAPKYVKGEVLIGMKSTIGPLSLPKNINGIDISIVKVLDDGIWFMADRPRIVKAKVDDTEEAIRKISGQPGVSFIEPNYIAKALYLPNDPKFPELYGMKSISAPEAWDTLQSSKAIVAVVDTGIDYKHPDLKDNIWVNSKEIPNNSKDDDGNGQVDDYYGYNFADGTSDPIDDNEHGSHCSGTIGGVGDNKAGVIGVTPHLKMMAVKVLTKDGEGDYAGVAEGINYAVRNGAKVISMSLGGEGTSSTLEQAVKNTGLAGVLLVAAAGNDGAKDSQTYPANYAMKYKNVISVAAVGPTDDRPDWSNYGSNVQVCAPGEDIVSTVPGNKYDSFSGTSMATPHVAGISALLLGAKPDLTPDKIRTILESTSRPVSKLQGVCTSGGVVNVKAALDSLPTGAPTPGPTPGGDLTAIVTVNPVTEGSAARVSVVLNRPADQVVSITMETAYRFGRNSARVGKDLRDQSISKNINVGESKSVFMFSTIDDKEKESTEYAKIKIKNPRNVKITNKFEITIKDND